MRYRELLSSCFSGDKPGISPVAAWQHKPMLDQTVTDFAAATVAEQQKYDFDFAKLTPASTWQSIDNGLQDCWNNDYLGRRQIVKHNISQFNHWPALLQRDGWQGFSSTILQAARLTRAQLPEHVPLLVTVFNPFFQAVQQAGLPFVLTTHQQAPALLTAGLNTLLANTLNLIEQFKDIGVDGVFFVSQHASADVLPADTYRKLALDADIRCIAAIGQLPFSMLHLHGSNTHWPLFSGLELPLHCDQAEDSELVRQRQHFSRLAGTLAPEPLFLRSPAQDVTDAVLSRRRALAEHRYVVSPGCALPLHVPAANIHAMVSAAHRAL